MNLLVITSKASDIAEIKEHILNSKSMVWSISPGEKAEIIQLLVEQAIDVVIIEWSEPASNQTPLHIELMERFSKLPFILICNNKDVEHVITELEEGVQDYLIRNEITSIELMKSIKGSIRRENMRNELEAARRNALEALAYKDRMLDRLSQQVRTPLNAITGMAELMQDTTLNSKQRFYSKIIRESGNKIVGLINDLLDFNRLEAGLVKLRDHPFNLYDTISESIHALLPISIEQKLDLLIHISPGCPHTFLGDDLRIRQILLNLIENGIKFTNRGYVKLKVNYCNSDHKLLCFSVEDTGKGIDRQTIPTLFKPFTKLEESNNGDKSGVGLGLAICQNLVQMMNGKITVESELGKGSVFTVKIPLKSADIALGDIQEELLLVPPVGKNILFLASNKLYDDLLKDYCKHWQLELSIRHTDEDIPVFGSWLEGYDLLVSNVKESLKLDLKLIDRVRSHKEIPHILIKNPEKANDRLTVIRKDTVILLKPLDMIELGEAIALVMENNADRLNTLQKVPIPDERLGEYHPLEILVADNNAINQRIVQGVLNRYSYQPKLVENGKLAVEAARERVYDVILMDIRMPEMGGLDATKLIRESLQPAKQPFIIALTADALLQSRQAYIDAGMDEVLYKPVQTKKLIELLARIKRVPR